MVTRRSSFVVALRFLSEATRSSLLVPEKAQGIPPFARKYNKNCIGKKK
jgi:hypothetical protein